MFKWEWEGMGIDVRELMGMRLKSQSSNGREWEWEWHHGNGREWYAKSYSRTSLLCDLYNIALFAVMWTCHFRGAGMPTEKCIAIAERRKFSRKNGAIWCHFSLKNLSLLTFWRQLKVKMLGSWIRVWDIETIFNSFVTKYKWLIKLFFMNY